MGSQDRSVCLETGFGLYDQRSIHGKRFFSIAHHPDRFWYRPSLLYNIFRELILQVQTGFGVKLTTQLHLLPSSTMVDL
jgi:hypothetical protein